MKELIERIEAQATRLRRLDTEDAWLVKAAVAEAFSEIAAALRSQSNIEGGE